MTTVLLVRDVKVPEQWSKADCSCTAIVILTQNHFAGILLSLGLSWICSERIGANLLLNAHNLILSCDQFYCVVKL